MTLMSMRLTFDGLMLAFFGFAFVEASGFMSLAQTFPRTAAGAGFVLTALLLMRDAYSAVKVRKDDTQILPEEDETAPLHQAAHEGSISPIFLGFVRHLGWIIGFLLLAGSISLPLASAIYVIGFLRLEADVSLRGAVIGAVATVAAIALLQRVMNLGLPPTLWEPLGRWF